MADWEWILASDYGRDKMLASEVDELAAISASDRARSDRLSSQLASLQGSVDSRLTALSAAFDAYVELGDVREQLAGFGQEAAVRRQVVAAVEALAAGRSPDQVPVVAGYWLPYATNAVVALVAGTEDRAAEEQARTLSRDADLFVVVLLGALGRGELVARRVPDLLVGDGTLTPAQLVLWRALLAGVYPEPGSGQPLLTAVGEGWRSTLAAGAGPEWRGWVDSHVGGDDTTDLLQWVEDLLHDRVLMPLTSRAEAPAGAAVDPRAELRGVAITLVAAGSDPERDLLARSRELRRQIEHPMAGSLPAPDPVEVRPLVREVFESTTDADRRRVLLGWLRPGLAQAVADIAARPSAPPDRVRRSLPGGAIRVGPEGPDADQLAKVRGRLPEAYPRAASRPLVPAAVAAVLVVVALVGLAAGWSGALVVLLLVAAVAAGGTALTMARGRQVARRAIEADAGTIDRIVEEATAEAVAQQRAYQDRQTRLQRLVTELQVELGSSAPSPEVPSRV